MNQRPENTFLDRFERAKNQFQNHVLRTEHTIQELENNIGVEPLANNMRALLVIVNDITALRETANDIRDIQEILDEQELESRTSLSEEKISENLHVRMGGNCDSKEVDICSICLDEYEKNEAMGRLDCGHGYHAHCIKAWLSRKNVCPLCRATAH